MLQTSKSDRVRRLMARGLAALLVWSETESFAAGLDPTGVEAFLRPVVERALAEHRVPGAAVAVVASGRVVLVQGYGLADLEQRRPVDAERTVFRVGSVSKPVTATAAMQLVERGRLDLHADVNRYLEGFRIEPGYPEPVTVEQLFTHTAGFDVRLIGTAAPSEEQVLPLSRYLASQTPPRVRPPGQVLAYSNHGYTLLGLLVERAAGRPFPEAVEELLFRPLGMEQSSFRFPPQLQARAAVGYLPARTGFRVAPAVHPQIGPAAGLSTTASDMARFLLAHLEGGSAGETQVLGSEALAQMHRRRFTQDPRMSGMTLGFFEVMENGRRLLVHGGGIRGYMALILLDPEARLGLFVATNSNDGLGLIWEVAYKLLNRWFPGPPPILTPPPGAAVRAGRFTGTYRLANHPRTNLERAGALRPGADLAVTADPDGTLQVFGQRYVEVAPRLYRKEKGDLQLAFVEDREGRVTHMLTTDVFFGVETWDRLPWHEAGMLHSFLMTAMLVVFGLFLIVRPGPRQDSALLGEVQEEPRVLRQARRLAVLACALDLLFVLLMFLGVRQLGPGGVLYGVAPLMLAALVVPVVNVPFTLALPLFAVQAWRQGSWPLLARLYYTLVTMAAVAFLGLLHRWNLLGLRL